MELTRYQEREEKLRHTSVGYKWFRLIDFLFPVVGILKWNKAVWSRIFSPSVLSPFETAFDCNISGSLLEILLPWIGYKKKIELWDLQLIIWEGSPQSRRHRPVWEEGLDFWPPSLPARQRKHKSWTRSYGRWIPTQHACLNFDECWKTRI